MARKLRAPNPFFDIPCSTSGGEYVDNVSNSNQYMSGSEGRRPRRLRRIQPAAVPLSVHANKNSSKIRKKRIANKSKPPNSKIPYAEFTSSSGEQKLDGPRHATTDIDKESLPVIKAMLKAKRHRNARAVVINSEVERSVEQGSESNSDSEEGQPEQKRDFHGLKKLRRSERAEIRFLYDFLQENGLECLAEIYDRAIITIIKVLSNDYEGDRDDLCDDQKYITAGFLGRYQGRLRPGAVSVLSEKERKNLKNVRPAAVEKMNQDESSPSNDSVEDTMPSLAALTSAMEQPKRMLAEHLKEEGQAWSRATKTTDPAQQQGKVLRQYVSAHTKRMQQEYEARKAETLGDRARQKVEDRQNNDGNGKARRKAERSNTPTSSGSSSCRPTKEKAKVTKKRYADEAAPDPKVAKRPKTNEGNAGVMVEPGNMGNVGPLLPRSTPFILHARRTTLQAPLTILPAPIASPRVFIAPRVPQLSRGVSVIEIDSD